MKTIIWVIIFCTLASLGLAQYNEKEILFQQAYQMLAQRQYSQAQQLFIQLLDKYPNDLNSILQLLSIYFSLSQTDKAEALIVKYQRVLPSQTYAEQHIQLLLMQAKPIEAWQESMDYLDLYSHDEYKYRFLASFFERKAFYDKVLDLYYMARKKLNNPELFRLEIANTSLNYRLLEPAVREYMSYLEKNPVNLFFTNNQMKTILLEDSTLIKVIGAVADSSSSPVLKELYAGAMLNMKNYAGALNIYKQLDPAKLYRFAEDQAAAGNDSIAFAAYEYAATTETDEVKIADFLFRMAQIRFHSADYSATEVLVKRNLALSFWKDRNLRFRSVVGVRLRKLMADNSLAMGMPADSAIAWLEEAKNYGRDIVEKQEIDLDIARLMIMSSNNNAAEKILKSTNQPKLYEKRDYLGFMAALLSANNALADSLMNEFVIKYPGSPYTNDAIYLNMLTINLEAADQLHFFAAIRLLQLNQKSGLDSLELVFEHSKDEELRLLAIEWSIGFGDFEHAKLLLDYPFTDALALEYAELLKLLLTKDKAEEQRLAREFLKAKPNSIFSPDFRNRITRISSARPSL
ncbi:MAG: tetratricopeptide repeat protein [Candidatus Cloacimonas sp.]|jgi:TolA-binding protein|nr:tetratricopeptide repeat protein [Candidatus Cloacimonas sp.]